MAGCRLLWTFRSPPVPSTHPRTHPSATRASPAHPSHTPIGRPRQPSAPPAHTPTNPPTICVPLAARLPADNIPPMTELTIDYGEEYAKGFQGGCKCGVAECISKRA